MCVEPLEHVEDTSPDDVSYDGEVRWTLTMIATHGLSGGETCLNVYVSRRRGVKRALAG